MDKQQPTVIIADDDSFFRELLKIVAQASEWLVVAEAQDGVEAIELYNKFQPSMLWLDMNMPNMSGDQALQKISQAHPNAIIIMLTGQEDNTKVEACLANGATSYVAKAELSAMATSLQQIWRELSLAAHS